MFNHYSEQRVKSYDASQFSGGFFSRSPQISRPLPVSESANTVCVYNAYLFSGCTGSNLMKIVQFEWQNVKWLLLIEWTQIILDPNPNLNLFPFIWDIVKYFFSTRKCNPSLYWSFFYAHTHVPSPLGSVTQLPKYPGALSLYYKVSTKRKLSFLSW